MGPTYGFHSLTRLAELYRGDTAGFLIDNLQPYVMTRKTIVVLAMRFAESGLHDAAKHVFRRMAEHQSREDALQLLRSCKGDQSQLDYLVEHWPSHVAA
jgi:hypothetical protein